MFRTIGNTTQQFTKRQEHPYSFPAIAAYVTSYARLKMRGLLDLAGRTNCYYLVTDALFTNQQGMQRLDNHGLIKDNELGMLRIKHKANLAEFETLHHYTIGEHKVSGSKKKSARINPDGSSTEVQFESFDAILMRKPDGSVHTKPVTKHFQKEYRRGFKTESGWVKPLSLFEE